MNSHWAASGLAIGQIRAALCSEWPLSFSCSRGGVDAVITEMASCTQAFHAVHGMQARYSGNNPRCVGYD